MDYYEWKKGENPKLSDNFYGAEFTCKCSNADCIEQKIAKELIEKLQKVRNIIKTNIEVTSGYRCTKYQKHLVDSKVNTVVGKTSAHEQGLAADVRAPSLLQAEFYNKLFKEFNNLGFARSFTHVDVRPMKADGTKRLWNY